MFTKNYNYMYCLNLTGLAHEAENLVSYNGTNFLDGSSVTATNRNLSNIMNMITSDHQLVGSESNSSSYGIAGVIFGTGTSEPTSEDYRLSGDIITAIKPANVLKNIKVHSENEAKHLTAEYTITNTSDSDITIGEIGLIVNMYYVKPNSSTAKYTQYLIERTVLELPLTIQAGNIGRVTYVISISNPANSTATGEATV